MQHRLAELMSHPGEGNLHHVDLCHSITWSILHISVQVRKQKLPAGRPCQEPRECPGWEEWRGFGSGAGVTAATALSSICWKETTTMWFCSLPARSSLFQLAWAECGGEAQLVSFTEISLITSAVAEIYGEWPFLCPWCPSVVVVGNPGSLSNIETLVKIYKCTQKCWCEWLHWVPGRCFSAAGKLSCGRARVFLQSWKQGLSQPHAQQLVPCSLCLTALTRYLRAYGASPGLHSYAQEPTVLFQSGFAVYCSWQVQLLFPSLQAKLLPVRRHPKLPRTCQPSAMH